MGGMAGPPGVTATGAQGGGLVAWTMARTYGSTTSQGMIRKAARHLAQTIRQVGSGVARSTSRLPRARSSASAVADVTLASKRPALTWKALTKSGIPLQPRLLQNRSTRARPLKARHRKANRPQTRREPRVG